jgi:F420-non-reducing hydrogenase large subunit
MFKTSLQELDEEIQNLGNFPTYYMGLVDKNNKVNFYDGKVRVVDPEGKEFVKYAPRDYLDHVAEHVEPWTYVKMPYLKKIGWKGFVDGKESGIFRATPLSRLNAADGMATPLAQAEYQRFYSTLGGKPVHQTLATHWARLVELLSKTDKKLSQLLSDVPKTFMDNLDSCLFNLQWNVTGGCCEDSHLSMKSRV